MIISYIISRAYRRACTSRYPWTRRHPRCRPREAALAQQLQQPSRQPRRPPDSSSCPASWAQGPPSRAALCATPTHLHLSRRSSLLAPSQLIYHHCAHCGSLKFLWVSLDWRCVLFFILVGMGKSVCWRSSILGCKGWCAFGWRLADDAFGSA